MFIFIIAHLRLVFTIFSINHAVGRAIRPVFQRRQAFIWVISHAFTPYFPFDVLPEKASLPHYCGMFSPLARKCAASPGEVFLSGKLEIRLKTPYFHALGSNADRVYNKLHFANKVVCQEADPFVYPGNKPSG